MHTVDEQVSLYNSLFLLKKGSEDMSFLERIADYLWVPLTYQWVLDTTVLALLSHQPCRVTGVR